MADVTQNMLSLHEAAKRFHNKQLVEIVELLEEQDDFVKDLQVTEANNVTSHLTTLRTSLAQGDFYMINEGVASKMTTTRQIEEGIAMLMGYSKVSQKLARISGNPEAFRKGEDKGFIEGFTHQISGMGFYGDKSTNPRKVDGLATRYNALAYTNVHGAGGSTADEQTSIYIVQHGLDKFHGIYPRGSQAGIVVTDEGTETAVVDGKEFPIYRTRFDWDLGIVVRDDRCVQRVCNIPTGVDVTSQTAVDAMKLFENLAIKALNLMPKKGKGAVLYCNNELMTYFDIKAKDKGNVVWGTGNLWGEEVTTFRGHPVRLSDTIVSTEAVVS